MPGAIAPNLHEGSRAEYLAQYFFASFGTAVSIPHQEDHGLDLFCTLCKRVGQKALAETAFTVQVKSDMRPWVFDNADSVRWLVEHPLPLLLCVVEKPSARVRVYHTAPRFYMWSLGLDDKLELLPLDEKDGKCTQWEGGTSFSLSAPILDFTITESLRDGFVDDARDVLKYWLQVENDNLTRVRTGIMRFEMPYSYETNKVPNGGRVVQERTVVTDTQLQHPKKQIGEMIEWLGAQLYERGDVAGATRCALLHRHLSEKGEPGRLTRVNTELNARLFPTGAPYLFAAIDKLGEMLDASIARGDNTA